MGYSLNYKNNLNSIFYNLLLNSWGYFIYVRITTIIQLTEILRKDTKKSFCNLFLNI
jgi:hypothetical protein